MTGSVTSPHIRHCHPEWRSVERPTSINAVATIKPRQRGQLTWSPLKNRRQSTVHTTAHGTAQRSDAGVEAAETGESVALGEDRKRDGMGQSARLIRHAGAYHAPGDLCATIIQREGDDYRDMQDLRDARRGRRTEGASPPCGSLISRLISWGPLRRAGAIVASGYRIRSHPPFPAAASFRMTESA